MLLDLNEDSSEKMHPPWGLRGGSEKNVLTKSFFLSFHVVLTRAFNKELLSMAAQKGPREEGGKVHKDLSQQRSRFLQSMLQALWDTGDVGM